MDQRQIFLTILGMALVTYLPRLLPTWLLASRSLPRWLVIWLRYVPVAVLSAMLFPAVLTDAGKLQIGLDNLFLLAALPTLAVAWRTRSLFAPVATGVVLVALARRFLPL
jgi:branched-subunit amino acid transport protein